MRVAAIVCWLALAVGCSDSGTSMVPNAETVAGESAPVPSGSGADNPSPTQGPASPVESMVNTVGTAPSPEPPGQTGMEAMAGPSGSMGPEDGPGASAMDPASGPDLTPEEGSEPTPEPTPEEGSGPTPEEGSEPTPQDDPAPEPVDCSTRTGTSGRTVETVDHAGVTRRYILHVPAAYTGQEPVPLMVNYHPLLTDGAAAERSSGYKRLADREGFIVAFPDGQESAAWNVGPCCTASRDVDDVGFTRALVAQVQSEYCIDAKRIYASGFSMGGGMSHYVACEAADLFAAVAPGAFDLFEENTCAPARPITVISFRSTSDFIVPYEGGRKESAPNGFRGTHTFLGATATFERWAEINGCTGQAMDEGGGCQTHNQCTDGVEVTLCTVGGGHAWPDAERSWQTLSRFTLP